MTTDKPDAAGIGVARVRDARFVGLILASY
jgi:hypothetical protein